MCVCVARPLPRCGVGACVGAASYIMHAQALALAVPHPTYPPRPTNPPTHPPPPHLDQARGAPILGEFVGGSFTCDAHHMTEPTPDGSGVARCITQALSNAGIAAADVNYVNAHATSTPAGDMAEYRAIRTALPHAGLRINATKSMIGHLLGAAGAVEAVATMQAIATGQLHPNLNLDDPEDEVDLSVIVGGAAQPLDVNVALSNSFGFGGHNSCIMFKKYEA